MKRTGIILVLALLAEFASAQGYFITRKIKEPTHGSKYFFSTFGRGYLINAKGEMVKTPGCLYDYDKMSGQLLLRQAGQPIVAAKNSNVQSFTLYDRQGIAFVFERVPVIDSTKYLQVLSLGVKYKVYKLINTHFVSANYQDDGINKEGHKYDEYVDQGAYYILDLTSNKLTPVKPKIKSIKTAFTTDGDKLDKFIAIHSSDTIGDVYMAQLGDFMNN